MPKKLFARILAMSAVAIFTSVADSQTWTTISNAPPVGVTNCMLLTDGGVMCQSGYAWHKLTPDSSGSYLNGTWSTLASLPTGYDPDAYASAVFADGRVVIVGGEYNNGSFALTNMGAVYDPKSNTWTMLTTPTTGNPNYLQCLGDAPATMLPDGRLMVGSKLFQNLAVLDPATLSWTVLSETGKIDGFNSEEGWTILPDGSIFTDDVKNAPASERFLLTGATIGMWVSAGTTPQDLHTPTTSQPLQAPNCPVYNPPGEIGPALLRPDGTVFAIGANGYTAIYTPPAAGSTAPGSWAAGPTMPAGFNVEDGPGALLPNGHVLFGASPGASGTGLKYFEFDGTALNSVPAPARASSDATYYTSLLVLPTGQIMFVDGSNLVQLYAPAAPAYNPAWAPTIGSVPLTLNNSATYQITGTQFNGLSQANAFGDESQDATSYPLVRITNNATGHVRYAKTHDHSTMGVATGSALVYTNFDVPSNIETGASTIQVVANGIPSVSVAVTVNSTAPPTISSIAPASGPVAGGTSVTIAGTNFASGATVTFGGIAASVVSMSATSITATTPAHGAGTVSVVVTNPGGAAATSSFQYVGPAPSVSSLSPATGTASGGDSVTINGANFATGAGVTFGGTAATVTALTATSITVTTPAHIAGLVSVVVTNPDGQSATLANSFTYTAVAPTITSLSPNSGTRNGRTTVTISGSNFASGATVTFGGATATVQSLSSTSIRVRTPSHARGTVNVIVTNPSGLSATLTNGYTFR